LINVQKHYINIVAVIERERIQWPRRSVPLLCAWKNHFPYKTVCCMDAVYS